MCRGGHIVATFIGTQQNDRLVGTQDDDTFIGLAGHDILTGGDGGDRFVYQRLSDMSVWTGSVLPWHESITELNDSGGLDVLDLSALDDFHFIANEPFTATGRSEYRLSGTGGELVLLFDKEGDGTADRYLVVEEQFIPDGLPRHDDPDTDPVFTNLFDFNDFLRNYEMGTDAADNLIGDDGGFDRMYGFAGDDRMYGKAGDDELFGGAGNDRLTGGEGFDLYVGGPGNDVYIVDTTEFEDIFEEAGEGIDHVVVTGPSIRDRSFNPLLPNIENLTLAGDNYAGLGNDLSNIINANNVNNFLQGGGGNDAISGAGGGDVIIGGAGNDWIRGGTGPDFLVGEGGADKFVYYTVADAGFATGGTGDFITDFAGINTGATERDRIDLHRIDADTSTAADDAFHFIGSGEFTGTAGELRDVSDTIEVVNPDPFFPGPVPPGPLFREQSFESVARLVEGDIGGDGTADFQLAVLHDGGTAMRAGDFYL
jgi:Ca2+-binding RTX toxin-like protein